MALLSKTGMMAAAMILVAASQEGSAAQDSGDLVRTSSARTGSAKKTGILTGRLSGEHLRIWKSIERIVLARDKSGRLLHPTLHGLWQQAEGCGHAIYIEMPRLKADSTNVAGRFSLEQSDAAKGCRVGAIRLYLQVIDRTFTSGQGERRTGFVPFEGLRKKNLRYAEVLGHELVHALLALTDPNYARLCQELEREVAEQTLYRQDHKWELIDEEVRARMTRIQALSEKAERCPKAVEIEIWRELLGKSAQVTGLASRRELRGCIGADSAFAQEREKAEGPDSKCRLLVQLNP